MSTSQGPSALLLALVLTSSGCKDHPAREPAAPALQPAASAEDAGSAPGALAGDSSAPIPLRLIQLAGEVDVTNRYLFTVLIEAYAASAETGVLKCSGVIISPRLVLTAGHCVCPHQTAAAIDRSACAITATLTAMTYLPPVPGDQVRAVHERYEGVIHLHPEFKFLLDEQGRVVSGHADLAVILLSQPLPERLPPVKLGKREVAIQTPLITVGHGSDEIDVSLFGKRRFNSTRVTRLTAGQEGTLLDPPKHPHFANDSGGPCLRETEAGSELIGISNRGFGKESTCTSTHFHRAWLHDELRKAAQAP